MAIPTASATLTASGDNFQFSPQSAATRPGGLIYVNNHTNSAFCIYWVGGGAFLGAQPAPPRPSAETVPRLGVPFDFRIANEYPFTWAVVGAWSNSMDYAGMIAPLDIQTFLATPATTKPVWLSGLKARS